MFRRLRCMLGRPYYLVLSYSIHRWQIFLKNKIFFLTTFRKHGWGIHKCWFIGWNITYSFSNASGNLLMVLGGWFELTWYKWKVGIFWCIDRIPADTGCILNVHKTFRRRDGGVTFNKLTIFRFVVMVNFKLKFPWKVLMILSVLWRWSTNLRQSKTWKLNRANEFDSFSSNKI